MKKNVMKLMWLTPIAMACTLFFACNKKGPEKSIVDYAIPAKPPVAGSLVIVATLVDISGSFPANELYNYAYVMKYKVNKIVVGSYPDSNILVGQYNPKIARAEIKDEQDEKVGGNLKSFQVGDTHYLVLSAIDGVWTGAIEDDYFKEKRTRYWAFWTDKL